MTAIERLNRNSCSTRAPSRRRRMPMYSGAIRRATSIATTVVTTEAIAPAAATPMMPVSAWSATITRIARSTALPL
jgi:hypothetical protein